MVTVDDHQGKQGIGRIEKGCRFIPLRCFERRKKKKKKKKKKCGNKAEKGTKERIVRTEGCARPRKVVVI